MALKLSIFTTTTSPSKRGDMIKEAMQCYADLADEVINVSGDYASFTLNNTKQKVIRSIWPKEFNWPFIGQQFQKGYEAASGDAVIHADLDFIFHEQDFTLIRNAAEIMLENHLPAMSFWKYQFILPDRYNLKSRLVIMVNKRDFGNRIKFDSGGDLCQPSLEGVELKSNNVPEAQVPFYNYEKLLKTKEQIADDVGRMDRAYKKHFYKYVYGKDGTNESAYNGWLKMVKGRFFKPQQLIELNKHPKYVQQTIKNLKQNQWGYNGFEELGVTKCYE